MSENEKLDKLSDCILKSSEEIESFIREDTGKIKYQGISDEDDYYELEGDRAGLIRYGLEIVKSAITSGKKEGNYNDEVVDLHIGRLFDATTEVQLVRVKRVNYFTLGSLPNETPTPLKYKITGWAAVALFFSMFGFSIFGLFVFLKWAF